MEMLLKKTLLAFFIFFNSLSKTVFCIPVGVCRHTPSCSVYAQQCIRTEKPLRALWLIVRRLLQCHPFAAPSIATHSSRSLK